MEQGARQQQVPVHHVPVQPRQVVCGAHHVQGVHQKAADEAVVHALAAGDGAKPLPVPLQHAAAHGGVVPVLQAVHQPHELLPGLIHVHRGHGYQIPQAVPVPLLYRADAGEDQLQGTPKLGHGPPDLDDAPLVRRPHRAGVVPHLGLDGAGAVGQGGA